MNYKSFDVILDFGERKRDYIKISKRCLRDIKKGRIMISY